MQKNSSPREPLSVLLLNDSFPPAIDGVANVMVNYAGILSAAGDSVAVATPEYPDVQDDFPYPVYRYPSMPTPESIAYRAGMPFSPETVHALCKVKPDIIHVHCPVASAMLARMVAPLTDAPVIFTYHTKFDIDVQKAMRGKTLQDISIRTLVNNISAADEVWVVSEGAGENLRSLGYTGEYIVMENGVDFPRGKASPQAVAAARAQWGIPADLPVFLFVGRMMWYKGMRISLQALRAVADTGRDFRFVLVGDGLDKPEIEALAAELGLADKCIFTGAIRDREALRAVFGCADLFLFPSTYDTNGIVVREAAACSCASALVAGSCAAEGVTDGETGYLFDGSPADMARVLCAVCDDPAAAHVMGENAAARIYLSWQDAVERARARYELVLRRWREGSLRRHAEAAGDDFYRRTGELLAAVGGSGENVRGELAELRAAAHESYGQAKELTEERITAAMGTLENAKERVGDRIEAARERREEARETLEAAREQAQEKLEAARRSLQESRAAAAAAVRARRDAYLEYLKDRLTGRLDDTREDWDTLLDSLHQLWALRLHRDKEDRE